MSTTPERTLMLPDDRAARLVIVADTHSHPHPRTAEHIAALAPDALLHAGDIGDLGVLDALGALAPLVAVRGNIDLAAPHLPEALLLSCRRRGAEVLRILLVHIGVRGARLLPEVRAQAKRARADLVVCGHSHVPLVAMDGAIAVFNPGSIGPRRFALPIVFGVLDVGDRLALRHVDCESGAAWEPGGGRDEARRS